jgi:biopolymer transport protein ExbD
MAFKPKKLDVPPPFVSLADMAFNLVLFFVIMAKTQDDGLQWEPAKATGTLQVPNSRVVVTVDKDSKVYLNGNLVSVLALSDLLKQELDKVESRVVLLKVHKETQASTFEPIMEACGQAGSEVYHVLEEER